MSWRRAPIYFTSDGSGQDFGRKPSRAIDGGKTKALRKENDAVKPAQALRQ